MLERKPPDHCRIFKEETRETDLVGVCYGAVNRRKFKVLI